MDSSGVFVFFAFAMLLLILIRDILPRAFLSKNAHLSYYISKSRALAREFPQYFCFSFFFAVRRAESGGVLLSFPFFARAMQEKRPRTFARGSVSDFDQISMMTGRIIGLRLVVLKR
jgi:hypothetical protein